MKAPLRARLRGVLLLATFLAAHGASAAAREEGPTGVATSDAPAAAPVQPEDRLRPLERELASERLRCATLEAEVGRLRRALNHCAPEAAEEAPGGQVETPGLAVPSDAAVSDGGGSSSDGAPEPAVFTASIGVLTALGLGTLLGLAAGLALADWQQRRRHGGFRL